MKLIWSALAITLFMACNSNETKTDDTKKDSTTTTATPAPAAEASLNGLTDAEKNDGWVLLFDGSTKKGWHVYNNKSDGSAWVVSDGTLHLEPKEKKDFQTAGGGDIVTDSVFENFDLKLEWKIDTAGNSGIMFNVQEAPKYEYPFHTGPEVQVLDNQRHEDAKIIKHRAGDLYDLITSKPETVKPALEWNQVEIVSDKGALSILQNGTKVVSTTMWDDNWRKMIAGSKFKEWKDFGTFKKGRIDLQDHGCKVWFRNIKIKKLA